MNRAPTWLAMLLVAAAVRSAAAQQPPARLPTVVVNAMPDPPGPRRIAGMVRDTLALPIDEVEFSIAKIQKRKLSRSDGSFRFDDLKPGTYEIRARKLGYAPQVQTITVDTSGGVALFVLLPIPHTLRPVVSMASRGGLSGVVGDTSFNPLPVADVRVVGHSTRTKTDSTGAFFLPLDPGTYVISFQLPGYDYRLVNVVIPPDSGRRVTVFLPPMAAARPVREAHNLEDFQARMAWRTNKDSRVYTRSDLIDAGIEWIYDGANMAYGSLCRGGSCLFDRDCKVIVNGGPNTAELSSLTVDDVEILEIYAGPSGPPSPATNRGRGARASIVPKSNTNQARMGNGARNCLTAYVWLR